MRCVVNKKLANRLLWVLVLLSMLTGCFGLGSKDEDDGAPHYYVIDVDRGAIASQFEKGRVLRINPVRLTSHFRGSNIVFRIGEDEYQKQSNHQFFSEPEEMITEQLTRWLQKSGLFSEVISTDEQAADMVLDVAVTKLYGDKREQFSPQAVLEMQFFLMADNETNKQALYQTGLRIAIDIDETTPPNVVKGWKEGLEELLATVEDDLSGYFSKHNP